MTGALESMAGYNEPNGPGRPANWAALTLQHQQWLWTLGQRLGIEVHGPSLHDQVPTLADDYAALGASGVGDFCSAINIHRYPGGQSPSQLIDQRATLARSALGPKRVHCSEGGYYTALQSFGGSNAVSEDAQAIYAPRHLMEYVVRGMKFWQYELMDDPDSTRLDREKKPGMVAVGSADPATWRAKPAFASMQSLLRATADPGTAFTPRPLRMRNDGPSDLRWVAAGRRDDSRFLVLWRDVDVYNTATRTDLAVAAQPVTVTLDARGRPRSTAVSRSSR